MIERKAAGAVELRAVQPTRDLPLIEAWVRKPHVARWWGDPEANVAEVRARSASSHAVVIAAGRPVGYLCWQRPRREELDAAGLSALPPDLVDIDILIGETDAIGQGVGPAALRMLLDRLLRDGVPCAGLGASIANHAALTAFEKAGFRPFRDFEDPEYGPCRYFIAAPANAGRRRGRGHGPM